jgi:hypothetical protein
MPRERGGGFTKRGEIPTPQLEGAIPPQSTTDELQAIFRENFTQFFEMWEQAPDTTGVPYPVFGNNSGLVVAQGPGVILGWSLMSALEEAVAGQLIQFYDQNAGHGLPILTLDSDAYGVVTNNSSVAGIHFDGNLVAQFSEPWSGCIYIARKIYRPRNA